MNLKSTLVAALSFAAFAGAAFAGAASAVPIITATNVTSSWGSTAGGVAVDENVSYGRLPGSAADPFNQVRWGVRQLIHHSPLAAKAVWASSH